ncbi:MAG: TRAP transporter small permease [Gammaproteobacteria bacterium]|nr:TRAP transporter small permease [Gammaproteobacteria bacterium]
MSHNEVESAGLIPWRAAHPSRWVRLNYHIVTACGRLSAILFSLIAVIITYEVVARYVFHAPTIWAEDISLLCQIWATCLGASWVLQHNALIRIDILINHLGPTAARLAEGLALLVVAVFACIVAFYGYELVEESVVMGSATASMLGLPLWATKSAIPVGFGLLAVQAVSELFLVFAGAEREREEISI